MESNRRIDTNRIRLLLIDSDAADHVLIRNMLAKVSGGGIEVECIDDFDAAVEEVGRDRHDAYLIDRRIGNHDGLELLQLAREGGCAGPVVLMTDSDDRDYEARAIDLGAADCLVKSELVPPLLARSIRYAIERRRTEQRLRDLAYYDELTGLANRELFRELVDGALARTRRARQSVALMFLDLDQFKTVNDTLGHTMGDALLKEVANRLTETLRETDTVARLGGDEFMVILEGLSRVRDAALVARKVLEALAKPFMLQGNEVFTGASIGIAIYAGGSHGVDTLIKNADMAMYRAKQRGRNKYEFHTADMTARALERMTMEVNLRRALDRDEFLLHYQPQMDLKTGRIFGVEALVRWQTPDMGLVPPDKFIPLAEETGLIIRLGDWVLRAACAQNMAWQKAGLAPMRMSVNLSARQFHQDALTESVMAALDDIGMDPDLLELELTEGHLAEDAEAGIETLNALKAMGVHVAIDDFGSGYSSLSYLKRFTVDTLKIDRSFVMDLPDDPKDCAIANTVISLAHNLGLHAIAEGVETPEQLAWLTERGCDSVQGYYISRPLPADDLEAWLRERERQPAAATG